MSYPVTLERRRALTEDALARALCDSSSHMNLLPHAEQRPCDYHRARAHAVVAWLRAAGIIV